MNNWIGYQSNPEKWVDLMAMKITHEYNALFFRFFHSGDFQSPEMVGHIVAIAERCPDTKFWVSTLETGFIQEAAAKRPFPKNMCIRVSGDVIDEKPEPLGIPQTARSWVVYDYPGTCPAMYQEGKCGCCRVCWDSQQQTVAYPMKVGCHYKPKRTARRLGL